MTQRNLKLDRLRDQKHITFVNKFNQEASKIHEENFKILSKLKEERPMIRRHSTIRPSSTF